jgi:glycosyltransferase involved in cell wall biosynthesis
MAKKYKPTVSIIVPIRNEHKYIKSCLDAILAQDYPAELLEVIFVDGMSDDGSREIITSYMATHSHLRLLDNPKQIVPPAMNLGIRAAQGEIIIRVDARTFIAPDYVSKSVHYLQNGKAVGVSGPQRANGTNYVTKAIALTMNSPFGMASVHRYVEQGRYTDTFYLGAYHRRTIEQAGFFDEKFVRNQDYEFNYRVRKKVGKLFCSPDIQSTYTGRAGLVALWRQYWQFGYWKTRTIWKHPGSMKLRHLVAPMFSTSLLITGAMGLVWAEFRYLFGTIVGLYLLANLTASLTELRTASPGFLLLLPLIFGIMHISWGFGFLWGAITLLCSSAERERFRSD